MIDLTNHPLHVFFLRVAAEYDRSVEKYGTWEGKSNSQQLGAVEAEMREWWDAMMQEDIDGPHGEIAELPQVGNVCGKRFLQLTKERP